MADTIPLPPLQPAQIPDFKSNELVQKDGTAPPAGCPQVRQRFWKFFMDEPGHKGHKGDQRRCDERKDTWASFVSTFCVHNSKASLVVLILLYFYLNLLD